MFLRYSHIPKSQLSKLVTGGTITSLLCLEKRWLLIGDSGLSGNTCSVEHLVSLQACTLSLSNNGIVCMFQLVLEVPEAPDYGVLGR